MGDKVIFEKPKVVALGFVATPKRNGRKRQLYSICYLPGFGTNPSK
jgi:hypothetical protein